MGRAAHDRSLTTAALARRYTKRQMGQSALEAVWGARRTEPQASAEGPPVSRPANYARSLFHLASASVALATVALYRSHTGVAIIAVCFATYAWSMEIARRLYPPLNDRLMRFYGPVAHPHEHHRVNSATWYATALVLLAFFAARPATMASLAVLGVGDPMAALVGRRWGKHVLLAGRSLEGTLAFVVSGAAAAALALSLAGGLAVGPIALLAVVAGVVGAVAELFATVLDDNLTIPLSVGIALTLALSL
jgi:dolichol kinase